jgi:hypothetical protein
MIGRLARNPESFMVRKATPVQAEARTQCRSLAPRKTAQSKRHWRESRRFPARPRTGRRNGLSIVCFRLHCIPRRSKLTILLPDSTAGRTISGTSHMPVFIAIATRRDRTWPESTPKTENWSGCFHPRGDEWGDRFRWDGAEVLPISSVGRITVRVLFMNDPEVIWLRRTLMVERSG